MIELCRRQLDFGDGLIAEEVGDLWEDWMRHVDTVLDDPLLLDVVYEALACRWTNSRTRGRKGTPVDVVLRLLVLKHMRNWSYAVLEREVRANLVYRQFTRIGAAKVPDAKTLGKLGLALGPAIIEQIHQRVVAIAQEQKIVSGRRMRVDTTVVETDIHYPTDASLLGDGVRVLTRAMKRITRAGRLRGRQAARSHAQHAPLSRADRPRLAQPRRAGQAAHVAVLPPADGHRGPRRRSSQALRARGRRGHQAQQASCTTKRPSKAIADTSRR